MRKLKQVRPEDFDAKVLLAAAREGKLYIDESEKQVSKEQLKRNVRAYVGRIKVFATPRYCLSVDGIWEQILNKDEFIAFLTPGSKARACRDFDKYNVMRIIGVLREKGVYQQYSDRKFNALLEQTDKDSPFRKFISIGIENRNRDLLVTIRKIVEQYGI
ncbi:MAG: hypothetical protein IKN75_02105 [Prevotella sp.]|nr:hypothetical protein [Prevotella sp.]